MSQCPCIAVTLNKQSMSASQPAGNEH